MDKTLEELKQEHGTVYTVSFEAEDEEMKTVYLKKMDKVLYKSFSALMQKDELKALEMFLKNLWIGGDEQQPIIDDIEALRNFGDTISPLVVTKAGELKKN